MADDKKTGVIAKVEGAIENLLGDVESAPEEVIATTKTEAKAAVAAVDTKLAAIERGIQRWVSSHLRNTPFSQDTGAWNVLQKALPELASIINEEIG